MLEYAHMLHVSYYAQNYAGTIRQGLVRQPRQNRIDRLPCSYIIALATE